MVSRPSGFLGKLTLTVYCWISQGPAVIGNIGSPEHLDYSIVGEAVNLAARLCGFAGPMSIIVPEFVYSETKGNPRFHYSPEQIIEIKGFEQPITVRSLAPA